MNTNLHAIRILCYGDSNTWGANPDNDERFSQNERWTGILQQLLGNDYEIIEEGYPGRTTDIDDPKHLSRNGYSYFLPCITSHLHLDYIIITLGTNDLKNKFHRTAKDIANGVERLIKAVPSLVDEYDLKMPKIILVTPAPVQEIITVGLMGAEWIGSEQKSKQLADEYKIVAKNNSCIFVDLSEHIQTSIIDGVHLDKVAHQKIAEVLKEVIT